MRKNKQVGGAMSTSDEPIWERLNIEKEKKDRLLKEKEDRSAQRELGDCTFKPQIKCVLCLFLVLCFGCLS